MDKNSKEYKSRKFSSIMKNKLKGIFEKNKLTSWLMMIPQFRILMLVIKYRVAIVAVIVVAYYLILTLMFLPFIVIFAAVSQEENYKANIVGFGEQRNPSDIIGIKGTMSKGEPIKDSNGNTICHEPIFKPDNEPIYQAIKYIRCAELEARNHDNTDGDADSCGGGQQRVSEFYTNQDFNKIMAQSLSAGEYNTLYNSKIQGMIVSNKSNPRSLKKYESSPYGWRSPIQTGAGLTPDYHDGLDFGFNTGDPVFATFSGEVEETSKPETNGLKYVVVKTKMGNDDKFFQFLHLNEVLVSTSQKVTQGELIGYAGSTGMSTAPHLHYAIYKGKTWWWNMFNTHNPKYDFTEGLDLIKTPFNAVCKMLLNANKRGGTLDIVMIARLKKEYPELFSMEKVTDKEKFINKLCATQRPIEWIQGTENCSNIKGGWLDRARKIN